MPPEVTACPTEALSKAGAALVSLTCCALGVTAAAALVMGSMAWLCGLTVLNG
jgi:hypothetical protein